MWDVDGTFGEVHGEVAAFLTPRTTFGPTLALRVGGKRVWGDYPFFEAAFVGGAATVRGLRENRYAGDASAYGNAELRLRLGRYFFVLPGEYGVFGLADVGRVFLDGESSDVWHTGVGGGFWFAFLDPANTFTVALARGDRRTALYLNAGFRVLTPVSWRTRDPRLLERAGASAHLRRARPRFGERDAGERSAAVLIPCLTLICQVAADEAVFSSCLPMYNVRYCRRGRHLWKAPVRTWPQRVLSSPSTIARSRPSLVAPTFAVRQL